MIKTRSVKSINPGQSPDWIGTGVIQTSYDIVKAHRGKINMESKEGEGTSFTIVLTGN